MNALIAGTFLGSANVMTDGSCNAAFTGLIFNLPPGEGFITSIASRLEPMLAPLETSEFSAIVLAPAAAAVPVSGQVVDQFGKPVSRVRVSMTKSNGTTLTAISNPFGYFRFDEIEVGETYIVYAEAKGHTFEPQLITVLDEISDIRLIGMS